MSMNEEQELADYASAFGEAAGDNSGVNLPEEAVEAAESEEKTGEEPTEALLVVATPDEAAEEQIANAEGQAKADAAQADATRPGGKVDTPAEEEMSGDAAKEAQRLRSWEGRLRKMEAELKAKGAPEVDAIEQVAEKMEAQGDEAKAESVEELADQVKAGTKTAEQAARELADNFGEEFVSMIEMIASSVAERTGSKLVDEKIARVSQDVDDVIGHIADAETRKHFEVIAAAVPDFQDIAASEDFVNFTKSDPAKEQTAQGGSAKDVIALLKEFKAQRQGVAEPATKEDPAMDAAEGIRSSGMVLPPEPAMADDYASAWEEASKS